MTIPDTVNVTESDGVAIVCISLESGASEPTQREFTVFLRTDSDPSTFGMFFIKL